LKDNLAFFFVKTEVRERRMELHYFPLRGRAEVLRLALAAASAEYKELPIDYQEMKSEAGSAKYPFGQAPTFHDEGHVFAQMDAILRYIARKFDLYGSNNAESTFVDMILLAVESIRTPYADLIYIKRLSEEGKTEYLNKHINKETLHERNGGAHFQFLENILQRNGNGFAVGSTLTIADIQVCFFAKSFSSKRIIILIIIQYTYYYYLLCTYNLNI
jgi:glutathione S-transferase P